MHKARPPPSHFPSFLLRRSCSCENAKGLDELNSSHSRGKNPSSTFQQCNLELDLVKCFTELILFLFIGWDYMSKMAVLRSMTQSYLIFTEITRWPWACASCGLRCMAVVYTGIEDFSTPCEKAILCGHPNRGMLFAYLREPMTSQSIHREIFGCVRC